MTVVVYGIVLVAIWVLAWGTLSFANVLSGIAVAAALMWLAPDTWPRVRRPSSWRVAAISRFVLHVAGQIVVSNLALTRAVIRRRVRISSGVIAVPLPEVSDGLLTLIVDVMALSPGTIPLQVTRGPTVLYVHVLQMSDVDSSRHEVERLVELACAAFGRTPAG